jgi:hypothetical protein
MCSQMCSREKSRSRIGAEIRRDRGDD